MTCYTEWVEVVKLGLWLGFWAVIITGCWPWSRSGK